MADDKFGNKFPGEILLNIFEQVEHNEDLISCTLVNKFWNGFATAALLSKLPLKGTEDNTLKALLCLCRHRLQEYAKCVEKLELRGSRRRDTRDRDLEKVETIETLFKGLNFPRLKSITTTIPWHVFPVSDGSLKLESRIEKLALSLLNPKVTELVLIDSRPLTWELMDRIPETAFALPTNNITSLKLDQQASYEVAAIILQWTPHLRNFLWSPVHEDEVYYSSQNGLPRLIDTLSGFPHLDKVKFDQLAGPLNSTVDSNLINVTNVSLGKIRISSFDDVLLDMLYRLNPEVLRKLRLSVLPMHVGLMDLTPLSHGSTGKEFDLTHFEVRQASGFNHHYTILPGISDTTLLGLAQSNQNLRVLTLGSSQCDVSLVNIGDGVMEKLGSSLPALERLSILASPYARSNLTAKMLFYLGLHCRNIQMLSLDERLDITVPGFSSKIVYFNELPTADFSLFPKLKRYNIHHRVPEKSIFTHRMGEECASGVEKNHFLNFLRQHMPALSILSRAPYTGEEDDGGIIPYCLWDGEQSSDGGYAVESSCRHTTGEFSIGDRDYWMAKVQ